MSQMISYLSHHYYHELYVEQCKSIFLMARSVFPMGTAGVSKLSEGDMPFKTSRFAIPFWSIRGLMERKIHYT